MFFAQHWLEGGRSFQRFARDSPSNSMHGAISLGSFVAAVSFQGSLAGHSIIRVLGVV